MEVTNGSKPLDIVPIAVRHPLIITWVQVKQMLNQQINKNLGSTSDGSDEDVSVEKCILIICMNYVAFAWSYLHLIYVLYLG